MLSTENETKAEYVRLAQYELREELGSGQYGVVRQVRCQQTNKDYAMKIIRQILRELKIGKNRNANISYYGLLQKFNSSKRRLMKRSGFLRIPPKRKSAGKSSSGPSAYSPLEKVYREIALLKLGRYHKNSTGSIDNKFLINRQFWLRFKFTNVTFLYRKQLRRSIKIQLPTLAHQKSR